MRRITSAIILLSMFLAGFVNSKLLPLSLTVITLMGVASYSELSIMARRQGIWMQRRMGMLAVLAMGGWTYVSGLVPAFLVMGLMVCASLALRMSRHPLHGSWRDVAASVGGVAYVGMPLAAMAVMLSSTGRQWMLLTLEIIWLTDTFALVVGRTIGRNKLAPTISPGKTIEGSIGGLLGALVAIGLCRLGFLGNWDFIGNGEMLLFCLGMSVLSQLGDLAESLLKRDLGVKDSGSPLTGHGGFLDIVDATLYTMVPLLAYVSLLHPDRLRPLTWGWH